MDASTANLIQKFTCIAFTNQLDIDFIIRFFVLIKLFFYSGLVNTTYECGITCQKFNLEKLQPKRSL